MQSMYDNLQRWTPFSTMVLILTCGCLFIIIYDTVNQIPYPYYIVTLLTLLLGGTGSATLISHGVKVANGVAKDTARETASALTVGSVKSLDANTAATEANTAAVEKGQSV